MDILNSTLIRCPCCKLCCSRDNNNLDMFNWHELKYFDEHAQITNFLNWYCPRCFKRFYPELYWKVYNNFIQEKEPDVE